MMLQSDYYLHVINGHAGEYAPLMARIALNLGHDSKAYPFDLSELQVRTGTFKRDPSTTGFNELLIQDMVRAAIQHDLDPWREDQLEFLKRIAGPPNKVATLRLVKRESS